MAIEVSSISFPRCGISVSLTAYKNQSVNQCQGEQKADGTSGCLISTGLYIVEVLLSWFINPYSIYQEFVGVYSKGYTNS